MIRKGVEDTETCGFHIETSILLLKNTDFYYSSSNNSKPCYDILTKFMP